MSRKYFLLTIFLLILSVKIYAWWSVPLLGNSTHYKLTQKALDQIDGDEYPDIKRFGPKMRDWTSGSQDDANAHGKKYNADAGLYDGGPFSEWWYYPKENDGFTVKYAARNFVNGEYSAYYFVALMAHLIADQAVPAHAANIFHASTFIGIPLNPDNL